MRAPPQELAVTVSHLYDRQLDCDVALTRMPASDRCGARWLANATAPWLELPPHPHVATLYSVVADGLDIVLRSQPVKGRSLGEMLQYGPLAASEFELIVGQLGSALHHAHGHGVAHGSINLASVAFDSEGSLKLLRWSAEHLASWSDDWSEGKAPFVMHYQAPEQIRAEMGWVASDVYGMGALLYRLAASRTPFEGPDTASLCFQILTEEAPRLDLPAGYPEGLADVVARCLSKEITERPPGIAEVVDALYPGRFPSARLQPQTTPFQGGDNRPQRKPISSAKAKSETPSIPFTRPKARRSGVIIEDQESERFAGIVTVSTLVVRSGCTVAWLRAAAGRWMTLGHPGIVRIYDMEEWERGVRILSEPVRGPDLREFFDLGPSATRRLPAEEFRRLVVGLCETLQYAHDRRAVHGALAPDCVILEPDDSVRLLRFSAEHLQAIAGAGRAMKNLDLLNYQAPEQLDGRTTPASDIYALGRLLFQVTAGSFSAQVSDLARHAQPGWLAERITDRPLLSLALPQGYPRNLAEVLADCMHADPSHRPWSAREILSRLYPKEFEPGVGPEERERRHQGALRCTETGDFEAARVAWSELSALAPWDGRSANNLGVALSRLGRAAEARECFQSASELMPNCEVAFFNLGWALLEDGQKLRAIRAFDRAHFLGPLCSKTLHLRGMCRGGVPAIQDFIAALERDPDQSISYLALADELEGVEHEDAQMMREMARDCPKPPQEIGPELLLNMVPGNWSGGHNWPPDPDAPENDDEDYDDDAESGGGDDGGAKVPLRRPPHAPSASEAKEIPRPYEFHRHEPRYLRRAR